MWTRSPLTDLRSRVRRWLAAPELAILLYAVLGLDAARSAERPVAWLALVAVPVALFLRSRPVALGVVLALGGAWLRIAALGIPETCDQLAVSRAALDPILAGGSPWGVGYAASVPPGAPFPYGPLAVPAALAGVPLEVAAMSGILLLLARERAILSVALLGGWVGWVELGTCGINDQLPAFLLLAGLLLVERGRRSGALLVGMGAAIKPYLLAWAPPLLGLGGVALAVPLLTATILLWLPILPWGPARFLASVEMARAIHPVSENALNVPVLRILALPASLLALRVRTWEAMALAGCAIFALVLFLDHWASFGYWLVLLPLLGILGERRLRRTVDPSEGTAPSVPYRGTRSSR